MTRSFWLIFLFAIALPAFPRPHNPKQPIPCSELWPAVTGTLGNSSDYTVVAVDNDDMRANFVVVGARYPQMNRVQLKTRNGGCDLQLRIGFTGTDEEGAFRNRVNRALKKLMAAKAAAHPETGPAQ